MNMINHHHAVEVLLFRATPESYIEFLRKVKSNWIELQPARQREEFEYSVENLIEFLISVK